MNRGILVTCGNQYLTSNILRKQKHVLKISVQELHNDMILPILQQVFLVPELLMEKYVLEIRHLGSTFQK